jgi:PTH1 family peptidyl-tRNA hydrolase
MKLIVGLGNPGEKYKNNRHNVGFMVIDAILQQIQNSKVKSQIDSLTFKNNNKLHSELIRFQTLVLAKPAVFMNDSGLAVSALTSY